MRIPTFMGEEFQPTELGPKHTRGLIGLIIRCAILIPVTATALIYGFMSYQGVELGRREWKEITFIVWAGTIIALAILVLRRRRTADDPVANEPGGGELLDFPASRRKK